MGLLSVTVQCIDFLAWPILYLGYPLYLCIRTIETGSNYEKRNLIAYWILFSFIYLFDHVFQKLFEWVTLGSYLRLIFIFWLVISQLNGAFYLYQNLIRPYLQFKLTHVIDQFYATCSESMEKLIGSKPECNDVAQILGEIQVMECTAKCAAAEPNQIENQTSSAIQVVSIPASAELIELPVTSSIPTKWICEICNVTVSSELTLQSHLRGKRHRDESKLWCNFCNLRVSGEVDMIAHLKGKRHFEKLQETFANVGAS